MTLLETKGLSRNFGGLQAVDTVDFILPKGEIRAVIGPNGAGKTTFVGMISGRITPTNGTIVFKGRDITRRKAWDRVMDGIVYTFQITSVFPNLSCYENIALAAQRRLLTGFFGRLTVREDAIAARVDDALGRVGLAGAREQEAGNLPYGHQRLLEIAMGLALEPELLILDEPTQGLSAEEIGGFCDLIREISTDTTILLIEHNMAVVLELAQRITVMDKGAIIAEGTPAEVEADQDVQRAYLGTA